MDNIFAVTPLENKIFKLHETLGHSVTKISFKQDVYMIKTYCLIPESYFDFDIGTHLTVS